MEHDVKIKINNWDKYQGRKDVKKHWWFKLSNQLWTDPDFFHFNSDELVTWICILSIASEKKKQEFTFCSEMITRLRSISEGDIFSALNKLQELKVVTFTRTQSVRNPASRGEERREEERRKLLLTDSKKPAGDKVEGTRRGTVSFEPKFDLEKLYSDFPRKKGKKRGMVTLARLCTSQKKYDAISKAIDNYAKYCEDKDVSYIKYFSTFMNEWEDWLEPPEETNKISIDEIIARRGRNA